jgi:RNA polymerase sigma-70 factor (ECF subfamily)
MRCRSAGSGVSEAMLTPEAELLSRAVAGDRGALERLLVGYQRRLLLRVQRKLPATLLGSITPEDVLQDVFVDVFRTITRFDDRGVGAFYRWLMRLTDNRLIDVVRAQHAAKRGGDWGRLTAPDDSSSLVGLAELLYVNSRTPSRSAAGREVAPVIRAALGDLKPEYREALQLRFLESLTVPEIAVRMNRSETAVHKLCSRGLQRLREVLGDASRYLSDS